jgi:HAE1 family hydrophobic/amphiphilic exporter-1
MRVVPAKKCRRCAQLVGRRTGDPWVAASSRGPRCLDWQAEPCRAARFGLRQGRAALLPLNRSGDTTSRFLPQLEQRYPDLRIDLQGQSKESAATGGSMLRAFALGVLGIYLLLSFQFRSFLEPLAVIAAIPLAFVGVILGHLVMGIELSMPSMMGFVSLAGVVVNDSILLVEFLKLRVQEGQDIPAAARQASRERFRAVLLTSATTIAGLLPLLAERSLQAQVLIPLATSIVFGLVAATFLVLFVVPALFSVFADLNLTSETKIRAEMETPSVTGSPSAMPPPS